MNKMQKAIAKEYEPALRGVAARMVSAEEGFIETLMGLGGISHNEAAHAMTVMFHLKVAKRDGVDHIGVKHGAFLEPDAIRNAVAYQIPLKGSKAA